MMIDSNYLLMNQLFLISKLLLNKYFAKSYRQEKDIMLKF